MTAPLLGPARAFDLAKRDLQAIWDRLPTMHEAGWWPSQPDRDRPTPAQLPGVGPDDVAGPTWDCGLGDHRVRQGWERMVCHLHRAEQHATDVLCAAVDVQSRPVPVCRPTGLTDAQSATRRLQARVAALAGLWRQWSGNGRTVGDPNRLGEDVVVGWLVDVPRARWLARQLDPPFDHIMHAMYEAQRVVAIVGNGKAPPPCTDCKRIGSVGQPRKGGKCDACYQRKYRLDRRQRQAKVRAARNEAA